MKKKLAVFFPGIGYTVDKPLMYYSRKLAAQQGYEIRLLPYQGFPSKIQGDAGRMRESFRIAMEQTMEMLTGTELETYDELLFVGKSIGTIVAAKLASDMSLQDRTRFVLYTPLEETFQFCDHTAMADRTGNLDYSAKADRTGNLDYSAKADRISNLDYSAKAVVFTGTDDPWVGRGESQIPACAAQSGYPCFQIADANHSLETGDVGRDIENLRMIMEETARFIEGRDLR